VRASRISKSPPTDGPAEDSVLAPARAAGFAAAGIVDPRLLDPWAGRLRELRASGFLDRESFAGLEWDWVLRPSAWSSLATVLVCCLSCAPSGPDDLSTPGDPHALIAPFARAHHYRVAVRMLGDVARRIEGDLGLERGAVRPFSNSRIPEKPLLIASGLAAYGRNGLAIVPHLGSLFVIAGLVIPVPTDMLLESARVPAPSPCGSCTRCIDSCPVGAIVGEGRVDPLRCIQAMAGTPAELSPEVMARWGSRLYGCQDCQSVCPRNRGVAAGPLSVGEPGPSISIRGLLGQDAVTIKRWFRGTAMGMSWISGEALLRNALVAAGNSGDRGLEVDVSRFLSAASPMLQHTARWALERLSASWEPVLPAPMACDCSRRTPG
jgi:epoxyqueuosine reductase